MELVSWPYDRLPNKTLFLLIKLFSNFFNLFIFKGNDWRIFAKRIGINENEIRDWITLKLQYPMARVLSFWSSRPEATVRHLHRHLNAPCFSYGTLAKRIENFYDVL